MPLMTNSAARGGVDPILTRVVQGYTQNELVGGKIFPKVDVPLRGGKVVEFDKSDWKAFGTRRAPGANTAHRQFNFGTRTYSVLQDRLIGDLPKEHLEEATAIGIPYSMRKRVAEGTYSSIMLNLEIAQADLATTAGNYASSNKETLSGSDQWANASNASFFTKFNTWREAVRAQIGRYPNTAIFGPKPFTAAQNNSLVIDRYKHTTPESITTGMLARLLLLENLYVGTALKLTAADAVADVWGDFVVLAYVPSVAAGEMRDRFEPAYGYTYNLSGYPLVEPEYEDKDKNSLCFPVTAEHTPELTSPLAGFLASAVSGL